MLRSLSIASSIPSWLLFTPQSVPHALYTALVLSMCISYGSQQELGQALPPEAVNNCTLPTDQFIGNAQRLFNVRDWFWRGVCVRNGGNTDKCYASLDNLLGEGLNDIRLAEYSGAAGVFALLPTIGALLGAPTNEIWRLSAMVPFGGVLAMLMSFGGAILPGRIEDYESDFIGRKIRGSSPRANRMQQHLTAEMRKHSGLDWSKPPDEKEIRIGRLLEQVDRRLRAKKSDPVPVMYIWVGLVGMLLLLLGAQVSMGIVERGALLPWWCASRWWIHLWYMMVIVTAFVDSYVQLPFSKQWDLTLSNIPYNIEVGCDGADIASSLAPDRTTGHDSRLGKKKNPAAESVGIALGQLDTLSRSSIFFRGPHGKTKPNNTLFVKVSVTENSKHRWKAFFRATSQLGSIGVFITGTAMFASTQLLSISMAALVLALVLAAAIFGRTIAGWIVSGIEQVKPMVHYVAETKAEACEVIAELFMLELGVNRDDEELLDASANRLIQIEIEGHIFVSRRRIARRSKWPKLCLGIIAPAFDLMSYIEATEKRDDRRFAKLQLHLEQQRQRRDQVLHAEEGTVRERRPSLATLVRLARSMR